MQPTVPATLARISGGLSYKRDTVVNRGDSFVKESHLSVTRVLNGSLKIVFSSSFSNGDTVQQYHTDCLQPTNFGTQRVNR